MNTNEITNSEDIIDSRDIIARIEDLESEGIKPYSEYKTEEEAGENIELAQELESLKKLTEEASSYSDDWDFGCTLIRDSYFTEYAEELCKDIGDIPQDLPWYIANHIDWDGVASEIKQDYTIVDFDGVEYFIR